MCKKPSPILYYRTWRDTDCWQLGELAFVEFIPLFNSAETKTFGFTCSVKFAKLHLFLLLVNISIPDEWF